MYTLISIYTDKLKLKFTQRHVTKRLASGENYMCPYRRSNISRDRIERGNCEVTFLRANRTRGLAANWYSNQRRQYRGGCSVECAAAVGPAVLMVGIPAIRGTPARCPLQRAITAAAETAMLLLLLLCCACAHRPLDCSSWCMLYTASSIEWTSGVARL